MHSVVETPSYLASAKNAGVSDAERQGIIDVLMAEPTAGAIMKGTGGARKLRYAREGSGKSGGYRIITYFGGDDLPVFLLDVFGKGDKTNLSKAERNSLAVILQMIGETYRAGSKAAVGRARKGTPR